MQEEIPGKGLSRFAVIIYRGAVNYTGFRSPFGWLTLVTTPAGLRELRFGRHVPPQSMTEMDVWSRLAVRQLDEYFHGERRTFDIPLDVTGTAFQLAVWQELSRIPYGQTRTYGEVASLVGRSGAARAVGMANNHNPVPVIVPCHRVLGRNGALTGYAGGLDLKIRLLSLEGALQTEGSGATVSDRGRSTAVPVLS